MKFKSLPYFVILFTSFFVISCATLDDKSKSNEANLEDLRINNDEELGYVVWEAESTIASQLHYDTVYKNLSTGAKEFLNRSIAVCVSGCLSDRGINRVCDKIKNELHIQIVKADWRNPHSQCTLEPATGPIEQDIIRKVSSNPTYLAYIGHSFGGWASVRLSKSANIRIPDHVFTIDASFGVVEPANL